jgi:hypothetical protein
MANDPHQLDYGQNPLRPRVLRPILRIIAIAIIAAIAATFIIMAIYARTGNGIILQ